MQQHQHWLRLHADKPIILLETQPADAAAPALVGKTNKQTHDAVSHPTG
jgi:hypothetical protein